LELTDALREYIHKRLEPLGKILKRLEEKGEYSLHVEVARATRHHRKGEKVYYVEVTLALPRKTIRIEQYDEDVRKGVDAAKKRLQVAIEQYKEKMQEKRK